MNTPVIFRNVTVGFEGQSASCSGLGEATCDGPLCLGNDLGRGSRGGPEGMGTQEDLEHEQVSEWMSLVNLKREQQSSKTMLCTHRQMFCCNLSCLIHHPMATTYIYYKEGNSMLGNSY